MIAPLMAALLLAAQAAPAAAPPDAMADAHGAERMESVSIPFVPPLGEPLIYERRLIRDEPKGRIDQHIRRRLVFTRVEGGYRLRATLLTAEVDGPPAAAAAANAALRPLVGRSLDYFLPDGGGEIRSVDPQANWATFERGIDVLERDVAAADVDEAARRIAQALIARLRASPPEAREGFLVADVAPPLRFAGHRLFAGEEKAVAGDLLGEALPPVAVAGITRGEGGYVVSETLGDESGEIAGDSTALVSDESGLVLSGTQHMETALAGQSMRTESRISLTPETAAD